MGRTKGKNTHKKRKNVFITPEKITHVNRTHKDTTFRFIFRDKRNLLQLYNALNDSAYTDISKLEITTLENVIYLGYKNDVSFLLGSVLTLAEHQGSWNPNMPLRGLLYFARLYTEYIRKNGLNMYGNTQLFLPFPKYVVFYNGTDTRPEREMLKLSASFPTPPESAGLFTEPSLECTAIVLNINYGNNQALLEKCRPLLDYSMFIHYIRENLVLGYTPEESVDLAVERCLSEDILTEALRVHRKEVVSMFLEEYNEEFYRKAARKEAREEGYSEGYDEGHTKGYDEGEKRMALLTEKLLNDKRLDDLMLASTNAEIRQKLMEEYSIA